MYIVWVINLDDSRETSLIRWILCYHYPGPPNPVTRIPKINFQEKNMAKTANKTCDYLLVGCIDFRFQQYMRNWAEQQLGGAPYDYVGFAGSTKELETILTQVEIAVNLHQVKKAILIHHEDCGAYGSASVFEKHAAELQKARQCLHEKFPDLQVEGYYVRLSGDFVPVF